MGPGRPRPDPPAHGPAGTPPPPGTTGRRLRVLLAEDHPINQKVATRMLEGQGHEVTVVGNGRLAVEALAPGRFDVVLMDLAMPEMGGFEALEVIRSRQPDGGLRVPIVALTAHAMAGDRERCLAAGFDDYLAKPVQAEALAKALARVVPDRADPDLVPDHGPGDGPSPAAGDGGPPAFDPEEALDGLAGDEPLLRELLVDFLEECPRLLEQVGLAAAGNDARTLGRLGHTLAGSAGHFAAPGVVAAGRRLEAIGKSGDLADAGDAARGFAAALDRFRLAVFESRLAPESSGAARA